MITALDHLVLTVHEPAATRRFYCDGLGMELRRFGADGARQALAKSGIALSGTYYGEAFGNWGGFKQGVAYDGLLAKRRPAQLFYRSGTV